MTLRAPKQAIASGEDSKNRVRSDIRSPGRLAAESVAFSNAEGGTYLR